MQTASPQAKEIKQSQTQHTILEMTKEEVEQDRLRSFVLYNTERQSGAGFSKWWKLHNDNDVVQVKIPYERHGQAKLTSNHAKQAMMADFVQFVDLNSQPNGRQADSYSAQFFFLQKKGQVAESSYRAYYNLDVNSHRPSIIKLLSARDRDTLICS